ncbi:hypothetical protein Micbo1qcDRAFT_165565 [Microdochium bolleyi]|uniref:Uncharacterized protein n=1 Tax=Microdochium bolleyi TaxID=196109 RepID=A0A136IX29_9PEZI|nr:hypothetical protein Micbo1qcDRAFT_165565 [Microdochium bolleyi]
MIQLPSGEWLARLDCTLPADQTGASLADKYLCLVLVPSYTQPNILFRRGDRCLTLIPLWYFQSSFRTPAVRRSVYLASSVGPESYRKGPLVVPDNCLEVFRIRTTYPPIRDARHGTQLWSTIPDDEERADSEIYLDCADYGHEEFALRVQISDKLAGEHSATEDSAAAGHRKLSRSSVFSRGAKLSICHQRDQFNMVELMLNAPDAKAGTFPQAAAVTRDKKHSIKWEAEVVVGGHEIFLVPFARHRWKVDVRAVGENQRSRDDPKRLERAVTLL